MSECHGCASCGGTAVAEPPRLTGARTAVALVGPAHVGIGTDYVFDSDDAKREFAENPQIFPESYRRAGGIDFFPPEQLAPLETELSRRGYPAADIAAIMGGNFLRVARQVWSPRS